MVGTSMPTAPTSREGTVALSVENLDCDTLLGGLDSDVEGFGEEGEVSWV